MPTTLKSRRWGIAWLAMAIALALHVTDEALTNFLPLYNSMIEHLRETYAIVPFPTFTFPVWLGGLIAGILLLFVLTPLAFSGRLGLRYLAYPLAVLMIFNALGHIGASIYLGRLAPGVYSSPILLVTAVALLAATIGMSGKADRDG